MHCLGFRVILGCHESSLVTNTLTGFRGCCVWSVRRVRIADSSFPYPDNFLLEGTHLEFPRWIFFSCSFWIQGSLEEYPSSHELFFVYRLGNNVPNGTLLIYSLGQCTNMNFVSLSFEKFGGWARSAIQEVESMSLLHPLFTQSYRDRAHHRAGGELSEGWREILGKEITSWSSCLCMCTLKIDLVGKMQPWSQVQFPTLQFSGIGGASCDPMARPNWKCLIYMAESSSTRYYSCLWPHQNQQTVRKIICSLKQQGL